MSTPVPPSTNAGSVAEFTDESLPRAIDALLSLNNYQVSGPFQFHGGEVDLRAQSRSDPLAAPVFIEATVEYVDNTKYGKDLTKLEPLGRTFPNSRRIIVSSSGFTVPVRERAEAANILTMTYQELFAKFQQFDPYVQQIIGATPVADSLRSLVDIYEEPRFKDELGHDPAIGFLDDWVKSADPSKRWLIVLGEYGTGKTALTRVLLHRWMREYQANPELPFPIRLELREFPRQFDAVGLLHKFLDTSRLSHVSVEFFEQMIRDGKIVMLLDGYDEMAQHMHHRERRACLEALAHLSSEGARGILTSRPNYFTQAEELHIAELLYDSISKQRKAGMQNEIDALVAAERQIDDLIEAQFIHRYERRLEDLSEAQTEALVERALVESPDAQLLVLSILRRIFRSESDGQTTHLSGKPVIISYLLELAEDLKDATVPSGVVLSEWDAYELITTKLMNRDFRRSQYLMPEERLNALSAIAARLSQGTAAYFTEDDFYELIDRRFQTRLRRLLGENHREERDALFADLRSSATLTRVGAEGAGWTFSHNSLREFLVARQLLGFLDSRDLQFGDVIISDAMRQFVASRPDDVIASCAEHLTQVWGTRSTDNNVGALLVLLFDGLLNHVKGQHTVADPVREVIVRIAGDGLGLDRVRLQRMDFSRDEAPSNLEAMNCSISTLIDCSFSGARLCNADFTSSVCDGVSFRHANLARANFDGAIIMDADLTGSRVDGASFCGVDGAISIQVDGQKLDGFAALGYLRANGATTDPIPPVHILRNDSRFGVAHKIARKVLEGGDRQRRGLTQRGAAQSDPVFAREFVDFLVNHGLVEVVLDRDDRVKITDTGRRCLGRLVEQDQLDGELLAFLERSLGLETQ